MAEFINNENEEVLEVATQVAEEEKTPEEIEANARKMAQALYNKKARDIELLCINKQTVLADYFVIAHGTSNTQVKALADEVVYEMGLLGVECLRSEGYETATWILLDFGSVIVHVFQKDARDYFKLEKLWADAEKLELTFEDVKK